MHHPPHGRATPLGLANQGTSSSLARVQPFCWDGCPPMKPRCVFPRVCPGDWQGLPVGAALLRASYPISPTTLALSYCRP
jgi:hypothetical protein